MSSTIEGKIVVITHAGHDECTARPKCGPQCGDQPQRSSFQWRQLRKGSVHDQDTAGLNTQRPQLRGDLVSAAGTGEVRGPRPMTPLAGVTPAVADAFMQAEKRLVAVHRLRVRPLFTSLYGSLVIKENATDNLVAKYRAVAEAGGLAETAARFRAGSLYHDFATSLFIVVLPPELGDTEQAQARDRYRYRAWTNLERAAAEYRASLAVPPAPDSDLWRLAAETELRRATALLEARGK